MSDVAELSPIERKRYETLREALRPFKQLIEGQHVLDFGAAYGLSAVVLIEHGASYVWGVEPDAERVEKGTRWMRQLGLSARVKLSYVDDTRKLDAPDCSFGFIVANAVFEHIPQPRTEYIRELWRLLAPGGTFLINETPNKYLPVDFHTLHLPLTNWLPSALSHRIGTLLGRFDRARDDWVSSGWRGLGYYELVGAIPDRYVVEHETTRTRHKVLRALGLPSALIDPYPVYRLRKP
jgi:SAM-dependent methyltransferase